MNTDTEGARGKPRVRWKDTVGICEKGRVKRLE